MRATCIRCLLTFLVALLVSSSALCYAIGHHVVDQHYSDSPGNCSKLDGLCRDGEVPPSDLPFADNLLMSNKGMFVASNWILGANHQYDGGGAVRVLVPKQLVDSTFGPYDGYYHYDFGAEASIPVPSSLNGDLQISKLADTGNAVAGQAGAPLSVSLSALGHDYFALTEYPRNVAGIFTVGGFGDTYNDIGLYTGGLADRNAAEDGTRGLRWGRKFSPERGDSAALVMRIAAPGAADYIKYEAAEAGGDSASGLYTRLGGSKWRIHSQFIDEDPSNHTAQTILDVRAALEAEQPGILAQIDAAAAYAPADADTEVVGALNSPWTSASTWSAGTPPDSQSTVWVNGNQYDYYHTAVMAGTMGVARRVFVGASDSSASSGSFGTLSIAGDLDASDAVIVGARDVDSGTVYHSGGQLTARELVVGVHGAGAYWQDAGQVAVDHLEVGAAAPDSQVIGYTGLPGGHYHVEGAGSVQAKLISVAAQPQSEGVFEMKLGNPSVTSTITQVGVQGDALFVHDAGTHTTGRLTIGSTGGIAGVYELRGQLNAGDVVIDGAGSRLLVDGGNSDNDTLRLTNSGVLEIVSGQVNVAELDARSAGGGSTLLHGGQLHVDRMVGLGTSVDVGELDIVSNAGLVEFAAVPDVFNRNSWGLTGSLAFPSSGTGGEVRFRGIVDASSVVFANPENGVLVAEYGAFVLVDSQAAASQFTNQGGVVHALESGSQAIVENAYVEGFGDLKAGVTLKQGGTVRAGYAASPGVQGGLRIHGAATVQGDSDLLIAAGSNLETLGDGGQGIVVADGELRVTGGSGSNLYSPTADGKVENGGSLYLGSTVHYETRVLRVEPDAQLELEVAQSGDAPAIHANSYINLIGGGALKLDVASNASLVYGDIIDILTTDQQVDGYFGEILGHVVTPYVPGNQRGMYLATIYGDDSQYTGISFDDEGVKLVAAKPGDTNLDGVVNAIDLAKVSQNWDPLGADPTNRWATGDLDQDGVIGSNDLQLINNILNDQLAGTIIPEPLSVSLLANAFFLAGNGKRRVRRS